MELEAQTEPDSEPEMVFIIYNHRPQKDEVYIIITILVTKQIYPAPPYNRPLYPI